MRNWINYRRVAWLVGACPRPFEVRAMWFQLHPVYWFKSLHVGQQVYPDLPVSDVLVVKMSPMGNPRPTSTRACDWRVFPYGWDMARMGIFRNERSGIVINNCATMGRFLQTLGSYALVRSRAKAITFPRWAIHHGNVTLRWNGDSCSYELTSSHARDNPVQYLTLIHQRGTGNLEPGVRTINTYADRRYVNDRSYINDNRTDANDVDALFRQGYTLVGGPKSGRRWLNMSRFQQSG